MIGSDWALIWFVMLTQYDQKSTGDDKFEEIFRNVSVAPETKAHSIEQQISQSWRSP